MGDFVWHSWSFKIRCLFIWIANISYAIYRTLVYLEGDASMRSYEDADGKRHSNLNIVQRTAQSPLFHQIQVFLP